MQKGKLRANIRRCDSVGPISSHLLTLKIDCIQKPSNYPARGNALFLYFHRTKVQMPTPLLGDPDCLYTCFMSPCQAPAKPFFFFLAVFFFSKTQIPKKYKNQKSSNRYSIYQVSGEKRKRKNNSVTGWQGSFIQHVCAKF